MHQEGGIGMLNNKLKQMIYNVQPRDSHSVDLPGFNQCQWVYGGPEQADWFHCGHACTTKHTGLKSVYCAEHHALCYKTKRKSKAVA